MMKSVIGYVLLACLASTVNAQASLQQCAAQICCANGNQDLSESCWSQCSSYQQQLAEIGCHILPPKATSSSASSAIPAAPTRTTSWGPGQFCQGYGPGEGSDSCITIPAGCYVVPSGYNVVPQLFCTATATLSSSVASSTPAVIQITSSAVVPSSSTLSPSSASSFPISTPSSATPPASTSTFSTISSAGVPPATTLSSASSSASTPPIITPPSSAGQDPSKASSSAVQSSALPVVVGGVVSSAASASSAAEAFSQNPTTDTQNALKQAVSAAQDATTAAKALADAAAFTALSAQLAAVLASLSEAAATLASAEALADIAAAVAPELAAAAAAAAAAKAIEDAGPQPTAQRPSANQPSVTQPSQIVSASSATDSSAVQSSESVASSSSAATGSFITSASASSVVTSASAFSAVTSSATMSASTCDACVACADSTIAPIATPGPDDPFAQYAGTITDNSTTAKPRKRFQSADFVEINARANSATRDVQICGQAFSAPAYNSYNGAGNGNSYSPYYSYRFQTPRCSTYDWALTQGATAPPDGAAYATEHIYELQLIAIFLRWLAANDASLRAYLAVGNRNICANLINQILFGQGQQWTVTTFGAGGNIKTPGSRPVDELLSQMSGGGGARAAELVYLESHLNGLKAQLFGGNSPSTLTMAPAQLALVAESSALALYLQDPHVAGIFRAVSSRVKAFYAKLDAACGGGRRGPCAANVKWADAYQTWQALYLGQIEARWQGWKTAQVGAAVAQIAPKARGSAMWRALLDNVEAQVGTGLLSPGRYGFVGGLTI